MIPVEQVIAEPAKHSGHWITIAGTLVGQSQLFWIIDGKVSWGKRTIAVELVDLDLRHSLYDANVPSLIGGNYHYVHPAVVTGRLVRLQQSDFPLGLIDVVSLDLLTEWGDFKII
jgi:hypothetical protein